MRRRPSRATPAARGPSARRRRPQSDSSRTRHDGRFRRLVNAAREARHRNCAGHRVSMLARPSLCARASRMVSQAARRDDSIRRESAEEVSGHLSVRFRNRSLAVAVGRAEEHFPVLDRQGRADFSRRQSAHQAVSVLGMGDRRDPARYPDVSFWPRRSRGRRSCIAWPSSGFTQSYTYFAWRDTKWELTKYFTELTQTEVREFFRPNLWPNTPDILPESLQMGGRAAFMARLVLAATLSGNYGIYGPPFEHGWSAPREPGSEEYLDSEKYQIHQHDLDRPDSLQGFHRASERIRRDSPAIAHRGVLEFHDGRKRADHLLQPHVAGPFRHRAGRRQLDPQLPPARVDRTAAGTNWICRRIDRTRCTIC